jgi:DMSO reductase anchor subunit
MKNKKLLYLALLIFALQIVIEYFYENKLLDKTLMNITLIIYAYYFTTFRIKKDYILFVIGIFCYLIAILTSISTNSSCLFLSIFSSIMGMGIHFWLYYMNKED